MNKKQIGEMQLALGQALLLAAAVIGLSLGYYELLNYLGAPRGIWQPLSLIGLLSAGAYIVLEVMKRRRK